MATKTHRKTHKAASKAREPSGEKIGPVEFLAKFDPRIFDICADAIDRRHAHAQVLSQQLADFARTLSMLQSNAGLLKFLAACDGSRATLTEVLRQVGTYDMSEDDLSWAERNSRALYEEITGEPAKREG